MVEEGLEPHMVDLNNPINYLMYVLITAALSMLVACWAAAKVKQREDREDGNHKDSGKAA